MSEMSILKIVGIILGLSIVVWLFYTAFPKEFKKLLKKISGRSVMGGPDDKAVSVSRTTLVIDSPTENQPEVGSITIDGVDKDEPEKA